MREYAKVEPVGVRTPWPYDLTGPVTTNPQAQWRWTVLDLPAENRMAIRLQRDPFTPVPFEPPPQLYQDAAQVYLNKWHAGQCAAMDAEELKSGFFQVKYSCGEK